MYASTYLDSLFINSISIGLNIYIYIYFNLLFLLFSFLRCDNLSQELQQHINEYHQCDQQRKEALERAKIAEEKVQQRDTQHAADCATIETLESHIRYLSTSNRKK